MKLFGNPQEPCVVALFLLVCPRLLDASHPCPLPSSLSGSLRAASYSDIHHVKQSSSAFWVGRAVLLRVCSVGASGPHSLAVCSTLLNPKQWLHFLTLSAQLPAALPSILSYILTMYPPPSLERLLTPPVQAGYVMVTCKAQESDFAGLPPIY
jgi:hypothetical protein